MYHRIRPITLLDCRGHDIYTVRTDDTAVHDNDKGAVYDNDKGTEHMILIKVQSA